MRLPLFAVCLFSAAAYAPVPARADMMIGGFATSAGQNHPLRHFHPGAVGSDAPVGEIDGSNTQLYQPMFGTYEPAEQVVYISDFGGKAIRVYPAFATGNVAPLRVLNPPLLGQTRANAPIPAHGELGVIASNCCIYTYPLRASGENAARIRGLNWGGGADPTTRLNNPTALIYIPATDEYAVKDYPPATPLATHIVFHARTANGAAAPTRLLTGAGVANAVGLAYDAGSRRLFVLRQMPPDGMGIRHGIIAIFADTASGDAQPLDTIEGSMTQLNLPDGRYFSGIGFDPYTSRLMVSNPGSNAAANRVLLFDYTPGVGGNVAPVRVLQGSNVSPYTVGIPFGVPSAPPNVIFQNGFQSQ
ncbi:hypothetical protein [Tahibacter harae]|uniref:6-phosphogluconolactonase (Cycloisomerase 2 family) n=1 Tax=Tahibacter harae TaxID=2963937 RepID=A0ABT1QUF4_9GAMM|nr:hypothetical protein [Tahibacter harae]MCQ4165909.1 hypothetical protein [Tahibacter harae]